MLDFDKMREEQLKRVNSFEEACKIYAEDCPVIIELLESHPMTLYRLSKLIKTLLKLWKVLPILFTMLS